MDSGMGGIARGFPFVFANPNRVALAKQRV